MKTEESELFQLIKINGRIVQVVGFRDDRVLLMPLGALQEVGPGCDVVSTNRPLEVPVGPIIASYFYLLYATPPHLLRRNKILQQEKKENKS